MSKKKPSSDLDDDPHHRGIEDGVIVVQKSKSKPRPKTRIRKSPPRLLVHRREVYEPILEQHKREYDQVRRAKLSGEELQKMRIERVTKPTLKKRGFKQITDDFYTGKLRDVDVHVFLPKDFPAQAPWVFAGKHLPSTSGEQYCLRKAFLWRPNMTVEEIFRFLESCPEFTKETLQEFSEKYLSAEKRREKQPPIEVKRSSRMRRYFSNLLNPKPRPIWRRKRPLPELDVKEPEVVERTPELEEQRETHKARYLADKRCISFPKGKTQGEVLRGAEEAKKRRTKEVKKKKRKYEGFMEEYRRWKEWKEKKKSKRPEVELLTEKQVAKKFRYEWYMTADAEKQMLDLYAQSPLTQNVEHCATVLGYQLNHGWESKDGVEYRLITSLGAGPTKSASGGHVNNDIETTDRIQTDAYKETGQVPIGVAHNHNWKGGDKFFSSVDLYTLKNYALWDPGYLSIVVDPKSRKWTAYRYSKKLDRQVEADVQVLSNNGVFLPTQGLVKPSPKLERAERPKFVPRLVPRIHLVEQKPVMMDKPETQPRSEQKRETETNPFLGVLILSAVSSNVALGFALAMGEFGFAIRTLGLGVVVFSLFASGVYAFLGMVEARW